MIPNNGQFSQRFEENTANFNGSKARGQNPMAGTTAMRQDQMTAVYDLAKKKGVTVDQVVTQVMKNSLPELRAYITSKGETPLDDPTALSLQAVLLRASDVATVARTLDISDQDALESIEGAESEYLATGSPDKDNVPTIPVQSAMACAMDFMSKGHSGSGKMGDILSQSKKAASFIRAASSGGASHFLDNIWSSSDSSDQPVVDDSVNYATDPSTWAAVGQTDTSPVGGSSIGSMLGNIFGSDTSGSSTGSSSPNLGGIFSTDTSPSAFPATSSNTSQGGILNSITALLSGINKVAQGVTQAANSSAGAAGAVKNAVSNIGANSIATYIQNNKSTIILVVILLAILIFAAVYAAKHKH